MINEQRQTRQVASCGLSCLLKSILGKEEFSYAIVDGKEYKIQRADCTNYVNNVLPLVLLQMLKDQFSDYEDLNITTPVRVQGVQLVAILSQHAAPLISSNFALVI